MENSNQIFELLVQAENSLKTIDHLVYITYPLINEKRLLKKILEDLYTSARNIIQAIIIFERIYKRIDFQENTNINFVKINAQRYNFLPEEIQAVEELLNLTEKYKISQMNFIRKDKLVIIDDNLKSESIGIDQLKKYLSLLKVILQKTRRYIQTERDAFKKQIR